MVASSQTQGRGRRGRVWSSHPGKGVYLSTVLRPDWTESDVNWVGVLGGIATAETLEKLGVKELSIKWPNDVLAGSRKIAGVLVEPSWKKGKLAFVVLGIGINIKQREEDWTGELRKTATSCVMEGISTSSDEVIKNMLEALNTLYTHMKKNGPASVSERWSTWSENTSLPIIN